jgi:hypothetical protein
MLSADKIILSDNILSANTMLPNRTMLTCYHIFLFKTLHTRSIRKHKILCLKTYEEKAHSISHFMEYNPNETTTNMSGASRLSDGSTRKQKKVIKNHFNVECSFELKQEVLEYEYNTYRWRNDTQNLTYSTVRIIVNYKSQYRHQPMWARKKSNNLLLR